MHMAYEVTIAEAQKPGFTVPKGSSVRFILNSPFDWGTPEYEENPGWVGEVRLEGKETFKKACRDVEWAIKNIKGWKLNWYEFHEIYVIPNRGHWEDR